MKAIEAIPLLDEDDWDPAFTQIHQMRPSIPLNEVERRAFGLVAGRWITELHWVIRKKWSSKHKIPVSPRYVKSYEPGGEVLYRLLELCAQVHIVGRGSEYPNAGQWFAEICMEAMNEEIKDVILPNRNPTVSLPKKIDFIRETGRRIAWMSMKEPKNPINPATHFHLWQLIEHCLQLRLKSDRFETNFWKPYLKSLREFERSLKGTCKEKGRISDKSLYGVLFVRGDRLLASFANQTRPFDYSIEEVANSN